MKSFTLFIIVLTFSLGSCRNTLPKQTQEGSSSLKAVYDKDYSLNLAKVPGEQGLYQFEICLMPSHLKRHRSNLSPNDSCVAALKKNEENIYFELETGTLDELALNKEERESLLRKQHEWSDYQSRIRAKATSDSYLGIEDNAGIDVGIAAATIGISGTSALIIGENTISRTNYLNKIIRENPSDAPKAVRARVRLKDLKGRIPIVIGLAAFTYIGYITVIDRKRLFGIPKAEKRLTEKELQFEKLNVLLQSSSPLLSTDPSHNKKVDSIKAVLSYLAMAWSGANTGSEATATHYCYPKLAGKDAVVPDCHLQELSTR